MPAHPDPTDGPTAAAWGGPGDEPAVLRSVVDDAPLGIALFDGEFRCFRINEAMATLQGVPAAATLGRSPAEYVPRAWARIEPLFRRALNGPPAAVELQGAERTAAGEHHWWLVTAYGIPLPDGGRGVALIASNITDRKLAERALAQREADLSSLFSSIDEGFCVCEMITDGSGAPVDYRFIEVNPLFESMTGLADATGRTALELVPELEPLWVETYGRVGLGRETLRFEQGSEAMGRWFDVFATPLGPAGRFAIVFKDVTARRLQEEQLRIRHSRAELVADLLAGLEAEATVEAQWDHLAQALVPLVADFATIEAPGAEPYLLAAVHRNPDQLEILRSLRRHHRLSVDDAHSVSRAATGQAQMLTEITPEERARRAPDARAAELLAQLAPRSHMAVPLDLGGGVPGVLMLGISDPDRSPFTPNDLDFVRDTAQRAGIVLAAGRVRQLQHDVSLRLQRALLPDTIQWHANLEIEARYHADSDFLEVGGDWYDTFAWPDGRIGVIVGDVVGHNLDSAAAMGRLRAATTALAGRLDPEPDTLLGALDDYARGPDGTNFATVVCLVVDPTTGALTYSSAGHPPALVVSPSGVVARLDQAQSPPLCSIHAGPWPRASFQLEPGSLVVVYSDGLIERRHESLFAGIDRLEALAVSLIDEPIATVADEVIRAMGAPSPPEDDVVVTCFRFTPALARLTLQIPAETGHLGVVRDDLRSWLDGRAIDGRLRDDVLLAVGEACSNAIEHAYHDREGGLVDVELSDHHYHLTARITDHGLWRPPGSHSRMRGRGTGIMRALTTRFERLSGPTGTTVVLNLAAPGRPPPT